MIEEWKDIKDYEGLYQVSNLGNIKSLNYNRTKKERLLKPKQTTYGYLQVGLCLKGNTNFYFVHRLVAKAFIENPLNKKEINHISGVKSDNSVFNLEWCNGSENMEHAYKHGLANRIKINQYELDGTFIKTWNGIKDAEKILKIDHSTIIKCCKGKGKTAGGFIWKYAKR